MDGKSLNLTQELLQQLQTLIPQAFSEGKLDTTALKTLLGEDVFVQGERYGLSWAGKSEAYKVLQQQTTTTLIPEPEQSVDWDNAQHVFIEGENLEVLKLLQKSYFGQVKMIYIDPPYNTGSDSFIYPDKFSETKEEYLQRIGDKNDEGYMLRQGAFRPNRKESGQYHSNWLNMMLPRLYLARNLLREDGVIFVSIDDNEVANLKLLMDEVFGEQNYINLISINSKVSAGASGGGEDKRLKKNIEYVLIYSKNSSEVQPVNFVYKETELSEYISNMKKDGKSFKYTNILYRKESLKPYKIIEDGSGEPIEIYEVCDFEIKTVKQVANLENISESEVYSKYYSQIMTTTNAQTSIRDRVWEVTGNDNKLYSAFYTPKSGRNKNKKIELCFYGKQKVLLIWLKDTSVVADGRIYKREKIGTYWDGFSWINVSKEGDTKFENGKKPISMINRMIDLYSEDKNSIILDFFAGSGSTAHAVLEKNEQDGGSRRFISVQLPEAIQDDEYETVSDITAARIKKVIAKIEAERAAKADLLDDNKPLPKLGFRKFTLAPSNFKLWRGDVIESEEELLRQMRLFATPQRATATTPHMAWELLLKSGLSLTDKVVVLELADGLKVYHTADKSLALVLDGFNSAVQTAVLTLKPKQLIVLDSVFAGQANGDSLKTNAQLTFEDQGIAFKTV